MSSVSPNYALRRTALGVTACAPAAVGGASAFARARMSLAPSYWSWVFVAFGILLPRSKDRLQLVETHEISLARCRRKVVPASSSS
jgi:hypothetical protein